MSLSLTGKIRLSSHQKHKNQIAYNVYSGAKNESLSDQLDRMLLDDVSITVSITAKKSQSPQTAQQKPLFKASGTLAKIPVCNCWQYVIITSKGKIKNLDSLLWDHCQSDEWLTVTVINKNTDQEFYNSPLPTNNEHTDMLELMTT